MPGVLNLFFLSASTLLALACFLACVFTDPGQCGILDQAHALPAFRHGSIAHACSCKSIPCTCAAHQRIICRVLMHCLHSGMFLLCKRECVLMPVHAVHLRSVPEKYVPDAADAVVQVKRRVPPQTPSALTYHTSATASSQFHLCFHWCFNAVHSHASLWVLDEVTHTLLLLPMHYTTCDAGWGGALLHQVRAAQAAARAPLPAVPALRAAHGPPLPLDQRLRGPRQLSRLSPVPRLCGPPVCWLPRVPNIQSAAACMLGQLVQWWSHRVLWHLLRKSTTCMPTTLPLERPGC